MNWNKWFSTPSRIVRARSLNMRGNATCRALSCVNHGNHSRLIISCRRYAREPRPIANPIPAEPPLPPELAYSMWGYPVFPDAYHNEELDQLPVWIAHNEVEPHAPDNFPHALDSNLVPAPVNVNEVEPQATDDNLPAHRDWFFSLTINAVATAASAIIMAVAQATSVILISFVSTSCVILIASVDVACTTLMSVANVVSYAFMDSANAISTLISATGAIQYWSVVMAIGFSLSLSISGIAIVRYFWDTVRRLFLSYGHNQLRQLFPTLFGSVPQGASVGLVSRVFLYMRWVIRELSNCILQSLPEFITSRISLEWMAFLIRFTLSMCCTTFVVWVLRLLFG